MIPATTTIKAAGTRGQRPTQTDGAWATRPVAQLLGALHQSMAQYPNIQPGQEFDGYS